MDLPPFRGDPTQMRQLVLNLVTNAVEACKEGGQVSLTLEAGPGQHRIVVQDSGVGIPTDVQPQIFEPFYTTRSRGTGLGLAVVHRIVEIHRGHVDIRSTGRKNAAVKGALFICG